MYFSSMNSATSYNLQCPKERYLGVGVDSYTQSCVYCLLIKKRKNPKNPKRFFLLLCPSDTSSFFLRHLMFFIIIGILR